MVNFGERLKSLRISSGLTQAELAERLNVTKSVVSYYERQERMPSPEVLKKLTGIFHVSADYLLGIESGKSIDVSDLSDEDISLLTQMANALRRNNRNQNP